MLYFHLQISLYKIFLFMEHCSEKMLCEFYNFSIEIQKIQNLVLLFVTQIVFVFNDVCYSYIESLRIGSPFSPLLCDIYMHYFEEKFFNVYKFSSEVMICRWYFLSCSFQCWLSSLLTLVNPNDCWIQLTSEI